MRLSAVEWRHPSADGDTGQEGEGEIDPKGPLRPILSGRPHYSKTMNSDSEPSSELTGYLSAIGMYARSAGPV
jgi:hypothetical protein